jgi:hypothetical protein
METIIEELKQEMETDGGKGQDNEATGSEEHKRVMEAVDKGSYRFTELLQTASRKGIFWLMCGYSPKFIISNTPWQERHQYAMANCLRTLATQLTHQHQGLC